MRKRLRNIRPATLIALLALFVALGGTATALTIITGKNVKNGSLTGDDVKNGSLTSADLRRGTLSGIRGAKGPAGPEGPAGPKGDAGERGPQGVPGTAGIPPWGEIPSGQLVTGSQQVMFEVRQGSTTTFEITVPLPAKAPVALTPTTVNFAGGWFIAGDEDDAHCPGTANDPLPDPGMVCIYPVSTSPTNVADNSAFGDAAPDPTSGFVVQWAPVGLVPAGAIGIAFKWAYRAP